MIYPLEEIGLHPRYYLSVLWWLGLLRRKPPIFKQSFKALSNNNQILLGLLFFIHVIPFIFMFSLLIRMILLISLDVLCQVDVLLLSDQQLYCIFNLKNNIRGFLLLSSYFFKIIFMMAMINFIFERLKIVLNRTLLIVCFVILIVSKYYGNNFVFMGFLLYIAGFHELFPLLLINYISFGLIAANVIDSYTIITAIICGLILGEMFNIIASLLGVKSLKINFIIGLVFFVIIFYYMRNFIVIITFIAFTFGLLQFYYQIMHTFFIWPKVKGNWYTYHPITWDDLCSIPFIGLDRLLVSYTETNEIAGKEEIERLISSYHSQKIMALRAKTILIARKSNQINSLIKLDNITAQLPQGDKGFLLQNIRIHEMTEKICSIQRRLDCITRPVLQEPTAALLCKEIENFRHTVAGFREPLASEFRKAASHWLEIAEKQWNEVKVIVSKEPTPQIFRAGDPVDCNQEAFVPRYPIFGELEKQLMLSTGCPGLILYGRRRMGKSTILENVSAFLSNNVIFVIDTMENPQAFSSLESFTRLLMKKLKESDSLFSAFNDESADLPGLQCFLEKCNQHLEKASRRLFLALDEYENIDQKIGEGVFPVDILAAIRTSIQTHRQITWVFAGSHDINELKHAPWSSYLVSTRTIEVPLFTEEETRLLLTEPMKHSSLWENDSEARPHFDSSFWGENGIERIHTEAGGWPHLVQLIAETIVDIINDEYTRYVTPDLMERSLDKAIVRGDAVLSRLLLDECSLPGEREYIYGFYKKDYQPIPEDDAIRRSLRRRLLVDEENGKWLLRVPLMQRWLRKRS